MGYTHARGDRVGTVGQPGRMARSAGTGVRIMTAAEIVARFRSQFPGWRVFLSDRGRWWATSQAQPLGVVDGSRTVTRLQPAAVDADTAPELWRRLRARSGGGGTSFIDDVAAGVERGSRRADAAI